MRIPNYLFSALWKTLFRIKTNFFTEETGVDLSTNIIQIHAVYRISTEFFVLYSFSLFLIFFSALLSLFVPLTEEICQGRDEKDGSDFYKALNRIIFQCLGDKDCYGSDGEEKCCRRLKDKGNAECEEIHQKVERRINRAGHKDEKENDGVENKNIAEPVGLEHINVLFSPVDE